MSRILKTALSAGLMMGALVLGVAHAAGAMLSLDETSGPQVFAANEIEAALRARKLAVRREDVHRMRSYTPEPVRIRFVDVGQGERADGPHHIAAEGFALRHQKLEGHHDLFIFSRDAGGAMYGGLELAEQIRSRGIDAVSDTERNPYLRMRGTKFNIPLDLRTPSYSDMSDSAQQNISTVWDFEFWRAYLDALARDRYNYVSLWNLHPFPSMVKVPEYPDVALNDVWRSKIRFDEDYSTRTTDVVTPAMLANKEIVKQLTIDRKIDFWRRVMQYAKDRNIEFDVVTWNIFTYGVDGKYGITDALDNPKTVDYFRASVR